MDKQKNQEDTLSSTIKKKRNQILRDKIVSDLIQKEHEINAFYEVKPIENHVVSINLARQIHRKFNFNNLNENRFSVNLEKTLDYIKKRKYFQ